MFILPQTNKLSHQEGGEAKMWSLFWIAIFLLKIWGSITNEEKEVKYWGVPSFETHVIAENIKDNKQMHKKKKYRKSYMTYEVN